MTRPAMDEFYVGYLKMPPGHARFLRRLVPLSLWGMLIGAAGLSMTQRDPGAAVWNLQAARTFEGTLRRSPYPMLEVREGGARTSYLLVQPGKLGAGGLPARDGDYLTRVEGWTLERDGRAMIELKVDPGRPAIPDLGPAAPADEAADLGEVELAGEIMDAKCFLGAMKPGEGRTHRSCAVLCVAGGIPPVLVTRDRTGRASYHLLQTPAGGPATDLVLAHVGMPVRVRGVLSENAGWSRLSITRGSITAAD